MKKTTILNIKRKKDRCPFAQILVSVNETHEMSAVPHYEQLNMQSNGCNASPGRSKVEEICVGGAKWAHKLSGKIQRRELSPQRYKVAIFGKIIERAFQRTYFQGQRTIDACEKIRKV